MKNLSYILSTAVFCLIFIFKTTNAVAQVTLCDTCNYTLKLEKMPDILDSITPDPPILNVTEYEGCPVGDTIYRNIHFIHGLGGSANSWAKPAVWTGNNFKTGKTVVNYDAKLQTSFNYIADNLLEPQMTDGSNQVTSNHPNRCLKRDFAIAHSQGGIAARYLDWKWDTELSGDFGIRSFYGLVTFGTPHAGAHIALTKSEHNAFIKEIASSVFLEKPYGVLYDITSSWPVQAFLGLSGSDIQTKIDTAIKDHLAPLSTGSLHTPTLDEMKPESPTMDSINNHQSRLRKVAFYGIEQEPECWRVISGITDTAAEDYDLWEAKRDGQFIKKMEDARAAHRGAIANNKDKIRRRTIVKFGSNFLVLPIVSKLWTNPITNTINELEEENKYRQQSIDFLNNANTQWRYLIGSYHRDSVETFTETKHKVTFKVKYGWLGKWYNDEKSGFDNWWDAQAYYNDLDVYKKKDMQINTHTETTTRKKFFPSDGVVLVKSQKAFPGVGGRTDKMEGDNHFQMRNSPETERVMVKLFNGDYDSYFYTEK
jgi:hypothetical protein